MAISKLNVESLVCLSIQNGTADGSEVLVKERGSRDEALEASEVIDEINAADAEVTYGNLW